MMNVKCLPWGQAGGNSSTNASHVGGGAIAGAQEHVVRVTTCPALSRMEVFPRMWDLQC